MNGSSIHDTVRLALATALVCGFTTLTNLPFGTYASLAVITVSIGNYGNTLELGRQRLIGTLIGGVVVAFGYQGLGHLPVAVALPLALLLARLIAGSLRLTVGYSVCCYVVIMGWLEHDQQLAGWIPLRLFWTAFGILVALLSLRLFWPSRARLEQRQGLLALLLELARTVDLFGADLTSAERRRQLAERLRELRVSLLSLREQRQAALLELGSRADQHPVARMWELLDQACEALCLDLDELRRLPEPEWKAWELQAMGRAAEEFVQSASGRLLLWQQQLGRPHRLQPPPASPRPALPLQALQTPAVLTACQRLNPVELPRVASWLIALSRIDHTLESTERQWRALVG
jgi:uncharacterized membrane protein YccC